MVVLADPITQGVMPSSVRQGELETLLVLLDELRQAAPADMQHDLTSLVTLLRAALPHLVLFAPALDALQDEACQLLGAEALHQASLGVATTCHSGSHQPDAAARRAA